MKINNKIGSFSFEKFGIFKKELNKFLLEKYGKSIKQLFKDKKVREQVYKECMGFNYSTDVFLSGNKNSSLDNLDEDLKDMVNLLKEESKRILGKE